ncbi:MAG TPA: hypothetical protein VMV81_06890, partial [Phycisphaerae bacterium]|nr:hypothetical protein [Phycisphaerae bacterium]
IALRTILVVLIFTGVAVTLRSFTSSTGWLAVCWFLAAIGAYERMSLRPELFSYALMMWLLAILLRGIRSKRHIAIGVALQFLWVNLHSYFLVGLMMTGAFLLGSLWDAWRRPDAESRGRAKRLGVMLLLQAAVCLANPWGVHGAIFPIETLAYLKQLKAMGGGPGDAGGSAWSLISEFHSPLSYLGERINSRTIDAYLLLLAISATGLVVALFRGRLASAIILVLLAVMSLQMRRNIAQFALAGVPLAVGAMAPVGPMRDRLRIIQVLKGVLAICAAWWGFQIVTGQFYFRERRITRQFGTGLSERTFPREAVEWLANQPDLQPNLFVDYFSSSNTLPWLPPRFKLFVDTNTFACPEPVLREAFDVGLGKLDHNAVFDRSRVNIVLLHCGPDTQTLVMRMVADYTNWALVHFDRQAVIFVRRIPEHVAVIRANPTNADHLDAAKWIASYDEPACTKALSLGSAAAVPISLGWYGPAATLAREAVRLAADYHDGWYFLAICEAHLGNDARHAGKMSEARGHYQAALDAAERVIALAPDYNAAQIRQLRDDMTQYLAAMPR